MMKFNEWKLIQESLAGGMTLGLTRPNVVGGIMGAQISEEFGDDEDEDDQDEDSEEDDSEDDDLEGDLMGSPDEDGVEQGFPPDDSEEMDGLPTPDEEMLGADDLSSDLAKTGTPVTPDQMVGATRGGEDDFLKDIDTDLLGDDEGGGEAEAAPEMPCPDCNPDGAEEVGDEHCETCQGMGFVPGGEEGGDEPPVDMVGGDDSQEELTPEKMVSMMTQYMNKNFMDKGPSKGCCEHDDFVQTLKAHMAGDSRKYSSGIEEDVLLFGDEPTAGQVGFAPSHRVGALAQSELGEELPVLGESTTHKAAKSSKARKYPSLTEWMSKKTVGNNVRGRK